MAGPALLLRFRLLPASLSAASRPLAARASFCAAPSSRAASPCVRGANLSGASPALSLSHAPRRFRAPAMSQGAAESAPSAAPQDAASTASGLTAEKCVPCSDKTLQALSRAEAEALLQQEVPAWELLEVDGALRIRRAWKTKNFVKGLEFFERVAKVAEGEGHHPDLHLEGWNNARIDIFTHSIGGLHKNDFILAAKIDALPVEDLMRKPKKQAA